MAENVSESLHKGARVVVTGRLQQRSWEDSENNKRTTIEVQVDEIGPSLRWATASVTKGRRSGPSNQEGAQGGQPGGGNPGGDSWGQGAQSGGQGGGAPVGSPQQNQGGDDW
jgi:single-strand DNA-binding protein